MAKKGQALPAGYQLGDYTILETLGHGGFGITYRAERTRTGKVVVIKENLPKSLAFRDSESLQVVAKPTTPGMVLDFQWSLVNFRNEAVMLKSMNHPGIVRITDFFEALGTYYYVMPYMGKFTLYKWVRRNGTLSKGKLLALLHSLLGTLKYLHRRNLLHRDIKPSNIVVQDNGAPLLIDFGTVRKQTNEDNTVTAVFSPGYSPFEQRQTHGNCGPWSDLYSLGATFYRLITGERPPDCTDRIPPSTRSEDTPHGTDADTQSSQARKSGQLKKLSEEADLVQIYGKALLASIDKALEMTPANRWQSADAWAKAIRKKDWTLPKRSMKAAIIYGTLFAAVAGLWLGVSGHAFLQYAIDHGFALPARVSVLMGADVDARDGMGRTLLMNAAANGREQAVDMLLRCGADAMLQDPEGFTAAQLAAAGGHDATLLLLHKKGAVLGDAESMFQLGECYAQGRGVVQNPQAAEVWYRKAAALGHEDALQRLSASGE